MHLTFRHPLVRSAILQSEPVSRHQAANAALAQVLAHHPDRRNCATGHGGPHDRGPARAADYLDRSVAKSRVQGRMGLHTQVLRMQTPVRIVLGAGSRAEEGRRMAVETGQAI
jgi:hypothetical protein